MNVRDQDDPSKGKRLESLHVADRIDVNCLLLPLHDECGVIDRMNNQIAIVSGDMIAREFLLCRRRRARKLEAKAKN